MKTYDFSDLGIEVHPIDAPDDTFTDDEFHIICETLTRMGIAWTDKETGQKKLTQTCHLLHKKGKYRLYHFKELFLLDGKNAILDEWDVKRRNKIAKMLEDWNLLDVAESDLDELQSAGGHLKVVSHKEKKDWTFERKYTIGKNAYEQNQSN